MLLPFPPVALFHCRAGVGLGIGHVMRCLTLADTLAARGWRTLFAVNAEAEALVSDLAGRERVASLPPPMPVDVLVVDNYALDAGFETGARAWARRIVVIDDLADRRHDCDLLLDQTLGRRADDYTALVPAGCRVLVGTEHALLRPRFAELRPAALERHRRGATPRRLLVSLGGTDPGGAGFRVLEGVAQSRHRFEVIVAVGRGTPGIAALRARMAELGVAGEVREGVTDMAALMAECDLAVGAGGTTSWERCCLGLPSLVLVLADNQEMVARMLGEAGAARVLGRPEALAAADFAAALDELAEDAARRAAMSEAAAAACDGRGAQRVAEAMEALLLRLRPATWADSDDLLAWRNDPVTRGFARNTDPVAPEGHRAWLAAVLSDPARLLLIAEAAGEKVGTVRFDWLAAEAAWEVSITVAPTARGRGLGRQLLAAGLAVLPRLRDGGAILATVGSGNIASQRIFEQNGFRLTAEAAGWRHYRLD